MRVIGGSAGSVPLYEFKSPNTRPMTDRVKTSLFSILDPLIPDAVVVDLFAGTGALGIEALSRGAAICTFVERDRVCLRTITRNLERTRLADRARIVGRDAWRGVRELVDAGVKADLVLFDPPFLLGKPPRRPRLTELASMVADGLLAPDGVLVYHHEADTPGDLAVPSLHITDRRDYSRNVVTFFRSVQEP